MKRRTALLTIAASLLAAMTVTTQAAEPLLTSRITSITPAQAGIGQQIVVTVTHPEIDPALAKLIKLNSSKLINLSSRLPANLSARFNSYKVMFTGTGGSFIEGTNFTNLGNNRYSVVVPRGAITGRLKLVRGGAASLSTGTFTVTNLGIALENVSQYRIVSISVNGEERLGATQLIQPGQIVDIGLPAGSNYRVIYSIGIDKTRPILTRDAGTHAARSFDSRIGGFPTVALVGRLTAREELRSTLSPVINGSFMTSTWMAFNPFTGFLEGYDFISNINTGAMTFRRWQGDPLTVVATGTVFEPNSWNNFVNEIAVPFRNPNGTTHANVVITLSNPGAQPNFITGDGLVFEPF